MSLKSAAALSMIALLSAGVARADSNTADHFAAQLTGPNGAKGALRAEYEPSEMTLAFGVNYSGLEGATTAEFQDGGKTLIKVKAEPRFIGGSSWLRSLTDQERDDLVAGKWTFKVSSANGELTGRVAPIALIGQYQ